MALIHFLFFEMEKVVVISKEKAEEFVQGSIGCCIPQETEIRWVSSFQEFRLINPNITTIDNDITVLPEANVMMKEGPSIPWEAQRLGEQMFGEKLYNEMKESQRLRLFQVANSLIAKYNEARRKIVMELKQAIPADTDPPRFHSALDKLMITYEKAIDSLMNTQKYLATLR